MKKSKLILSLLIACSLSGLVMGCSPKQVTLLEGVSSTAGIKSCAYDITVSVDTTGVKSTKEEKATKSSKGNSSNATTGLDMDTLLNSGKISLSLTGKTMTATDRVTLSSNMKVSAGGVSYEMPIYVSTSNSKLDFDLFLGVPAVAKSFLGADFKNIQNIYLSSKELEDYVKKNSSEKDYKAFQSSVADLFTKKDTKSSQVGIDMALAYNKYVNDNKEALERYTKGDSGSSGTYAIKFTKQDMLNLEELYFNNETYYNNFKAAILDATKSATNITGGSGVSPLDTTGIKNDVESVPSAKEIIADCKKALDTFKGLDLLTVYHIGDGYMDNMSSKLTMTGTNDDVVVLDFTTKLTDINKVTEIKAPSKTDDTTVSIFKLLESMGGSYGTNNDIETPKPNSKIYDGGNSAVDSDLQNDVLTK